MRKTTRGGFEGRCTRAAVAVALTGLALLAACGKDGGGAATPVQESYPPVQHPTGSSFQIDPGGGYPAIAVEVVRAGEGKPAGPRGTAIVHWSGAAAGKPAYKDTRQLGAPEEIVVGIGKVQPGFDRVLASMRAGDQWKAKVPAALMFGPHGGPKVPPNSDIDLEIEIVSVN